MESSSTDARLGTTLRGKYRLDSVLGSGGMATVYRAVHRNQAAFAVKVLHPELSLNADIRSRFLREGYAANSVRHPGAVLVVDDDIAEDGSAFLVMELLDGIGCEQLWEGVGGRVSPDAASAIVIQLLDVLAAAHAHGIVHRDIKPANLFLTRQGVVKVLDFGIARAREAMGTGSATGTGMALGTPAFMAPEQALGRTRDIDGRTDLWAVGATFFSLVSGEFVHVAETAQEQMVRAATLPPRPLLGVAPAPPSVAAIIDRALAYRREDRWPDATSMREALQAERAPFAPSPEALVSALVSGERVASWAPPAAERRPSAPTAALTTSAPHAFDEVAAPRPKPLRRPIFGSIALAAMLGLGGFSLTRVLLHPRAAERVQEVPRPAPPPPPRTVDLQFDTPLEVAGPVPVEVRHDVPPSHAVTTPAARVPPRPPPPDATRGPSTAVPAASSAAPPKSAAGPPSCTPPFYFDPEGGRHFRRECYGVAAP